MLGLIYLQYYLQYLTYLSRQSWGMPCPMPQGEGPSEPRTTLSALGCNTIDRRSYYTGQPTVFLGPAFAFLLITTSFQVK